MDASSLLQLVCHPIQTCENTIIILIEPRLNCVFPLRRRFSNPSVNSCYSSHPYLPSHPLLPPYGFIRHSPPPYRHSTPLTLNGILFVRRQGTYRASTRRSRHRRSKPISLSNRCGPPRRMVRQRPPQSTLERKRCHAERLESPC